MAMSAVFFFQIFKINLRVTFATAVKSPRYSFTIFYTACYTYYRHHIYVAIRYFFKINDCFRFCHTYGYVQTPTSSKILLKHRSCVYRGGLCRVESTVLVFGRGPSKAVRRRSVLSPLLQITCYKIVVQLKKQYVFF